VPTPGPQTARAETPRGVVLSPREARPGPVCAGVIRPVLPRVEGELLVVCCELPREKRERCQGQDAVCETKGARVGHGDQRRSGD
jgi:hypothetical protein